MIERYLPLNQIIRFLEKDRKRLMFFYQYKLYISLILINNITSCVKTICLNVVFLIVLLHLAYITAHNTSNVSDRKYIYFNRLNCIHFIV